MTLPSASSTMGTNSAGSLWNGATKSGHSVAFFTLLGNIPDASLRDSCQLLAVSWQSQKLDTIQWVPVAQLIPEDNLLEVDTANQNSARIAQNHEGVLSMDVEAE